MNLISGIKEKCVKWRLFGLGFVVLGGAVCSISYMNNNEAPKADATAAAKDIKRQIPCGPECSHSDAEHRRVVVTKKVAVKGLESVVSAKVGEDLEMEFGDDLTVRARVTAKNEFSEDRRSVNMKLIGQQGSVYWLEDAQGNVMGNVLIKKNGENQVFKFSSKDGDWTLAEIPYKQFVCASGSTDESTGMPYYIPANGAANAPAGPVAAAVPVLNSRPTANAVVYLDFDGEVVSGTRWNDSGPITALESGFSDAEIRAVWEEVAEDMKPFILNVTTERAIFDAAPQNRKMHVIITPTTDAAPGAGGVAYLDSFWDGTVDPCWCFNLTLDSAGQTVSHEVGHTFGLIHDGLGQEEYHPGNGTWGPIMGAPFGMDVVNWSDGNYDNNTNREDDLAIITNTNTNGFGYSADAFGDGNGTGFKLSSPTEDDNVSQSGIIETNADIDVFNFKTGGGDINLTIASESPYPNMNIRVRLLDEDGTEIAEYDPNGSYGVDINETLEGGDYRIHVEGIEDGSPDTGGFGNYGSIGSYAIIGTIERLDGIIVGIEEPNIAELSITEGNGLVLKAAIEGEAESIQWTGVEASNLGAVTFKPDDAQVTRATFSAPGLYTVTFRTVKFGVPGEVSVTVSVEADGAAKVYPNRGPAITADANQEFSARDGLLIGSAMDDGVPFAEDPALNWVVTSGTAQILNPNAPVPLIRFTDSEPNLVSIESWDGEIRTFKEITVKSFYEVRTAVATGATARWFIPESDALGSAWTATAFDDSAWTAGPLAVGFSKHTADYNAYLANGTNIQATMKNKSSSAYVRIPFTITSAAHVQDLKLKLNYNDGFVLYLNGVEVTRRNSYLGALTHNSTAVIRRSLDDVVVAAEIDLTSAVGSLVTGENILAIHGLNKTKEGDAFLINPSLEVGVVAVPFFTFVEQNSIDLTANQDQDGDSLPNLMEHALGTNPNAFDSVSPFTLNTDGSLSITLPEDMPDDVDYIIEKSGNLVAWDTIATKCGKNDWTGDTVSVNVGTTEGGKTTFSINPGVTTSNTYYRLAYKLRKPADSE